MDNKKNYISPVLTEIKVLVDSSLMATSDDNVGIDDVTVHDDEETIRPEDALSKRYTQPWDEYISEWGNLWM